MSNPINARTERQAFPDSREIATLAGMLFCSLGGKLIIDKDGHRSRQQPEPAQFRLADSPLPVLPHAEPHEAFHSGDEYRGAIKVLSYMLDRLSDNDRDFLFEAMGSRPEPDSDDFDFRALMKPQNGLGN